MKTKTTIKCTRCGECCKTVPCIFAQIKYCITKFDNKPCPELRYENGLAVCDWIEREDWMKEAMIGTGCDKPFPAISKNSMTFMGVVKECLMQKDFVDGFNHLLDCKLVTPFTIDKRPPIVRMIDEATGYDKALDKKQSEYMQKFIGFVYEVVWLPLIMEEQNG
jgi:hypothetical protein